MGTETAIVEKGVVLVSKPCAVVVDRITAHYIYGECGFCDGEHVIERERLMSGHGPWMLDTERPDSGSKGSDR